MTPFETARSLEWSLMDLNWGLTSRCLVCKNGSFMGHAPNCSMDAMVKALEDKEWRDIASAPRDGTVFLACNLDHPRWGCWPMYRRVRHTYDDAGEFTTEDLGGWVHVLDVQPDYQEGHTVGPEAQLATATDKSNKGVRYGWRPLPAVAAPPLPLPDEVK